MEAMCNGMESIEPIAHRIVAINFVYNSIQYPAHKCQLYTVDVMDYAIIWSATIVFQHECVNSFDPLNTDSLVIVTMQCNAQIILMERL